MAKAFRGVLGDWLQQRNSSPVGWDGLRYKSTGSGEVWLVRGCWCDWIKRTRTSDEPQPIGALALRRHRTLWPITAQYFWRSRQQLFARSWVSRVWIFLLWGGFNSLALNSLPSAAVLWVFLPDEASLMRHTDVTQFILALLLLLLLLHPLLLLLCVIITEVCVCVGSGHHAWQGNQISNVASRTGDRGGRVWSHV